MARKKKEKKIERGCDVQGVPVEVVVDEGKMRAMRSWVGQTDRFVGRHQQENVGQMR